MRGLLIIIACMVVSMYFFPFEFSSLRTFNTKQYMAVFGVLCLIWDIIIKLKVSFSNELVISSVIAVIFSIVCLFATDFNGTSDYAYATYIGSMWVWFIACYGVCTVIRGVHGYISIKLIVNYLAVICVFQCVIALLINFNPIVKSFVDAWFVTGDLAFMERVKRLYGIGAALDVAGGRFSAVLIMIAVFLNDDKKVKENVFFTVAYMLAFIIIGVLGSMMARTTTLGFALGCLYFLIRFNVFSKTIKLVNIYFRQVIFFVLSILVGITIYLYNTDKRFYSLLRFAFEGFFNFVEKGRWETDSTEVLKDMWIFPESIKTWIIGDGYFNDIWTGSYYMKTDVGYLRFIYYSGLVGLFFFVLFFVYLSISLGNRFSYVRNLFYMLLIVVFANWVKVSTDLFLVYAFFLVISQSYFVDYYRKDFETA